jgi:hypothetical protein
VRGSAILHHPAARLVLSLALLLAGQLAWSPAARGQSYRFSVPEMKLQVYVQRDGSARLHYDILFENAIDAHAIDVVDVGLPHSDYDTANMSANVDGQAVDDIKPSTYIDVGVEVPLGAHAIPAGDGGRFEFECTMPDMVYADTTDNQLASLQIKPTWFDPGSQMGVTKLQIAVHLPPGVKPEEVKYQSESTRYTNLVLFGEGKDKHVVAIWDYPGHRLSSSNPKVGVSFPRREMNRVVQITAIGLLVKWFSEDTRAQVISGVILLAALTFVFFRFSGGTGVVVFVILAAAMIWSFWVSPAWHLLCWPLMIGLIFLNEWGLRRRRKSYLPAMATVEGGGIKRGLTAPQAAVLLELPLSHVLTLVLFGLLKKGVLLQKSDNPLTVEVAEEYRHPRRKRQRYARDHGIVIHEYEHPFIDLLIAWEKPVRERDFSKAVGGLVRSTARMMKGFDLSDTKEYYQSIVSRAWRAAEAIGPVEKVTANVDRNVDWMMLDPDWSGRFGRWQSRGYNYIPIWSRRCADSGAGAAAASLGGGKSAAPQTSLGEVAHSFVGWTENTTGSLASAIEPGSMGLKASSGGFLDLSGADKITADVFEAMSKSGGSGGGGGGGGGCACACAGCACACACAGGGR